MYLSTTKLLESIKLKFLPSELFKSMDKLNFFYKIKLQTHLIFWKKFYVGISKKKFSIKIVDPSHKGYPSNPRIPGAVLL